MNGDVTLPKNRGDSSSWPSLVIKWNFWYQKRVTFNNCSKRSHRNPKQPRLLLRLMSRTITEDITKQLTEHEDNRMVPT